MRSQKRELSSFSRARHSKSLCLRPENEEELSFCFSQSSAKGFLARGQGLSYSDCALNDEGYLIDTQRFNHFKHFDKKTGIVACQSGISFAELFVLDEDYIPAVLPGTAHATLAGGIANDVHGKNHSFSGSFGDHILGFTLHTGQKLYHCTREKHSELFYATIGGLGLTGVITELSLQLHKAPRYVAVTTTSFTDFSKLFSSLENSKKATDYQAAWLDLANSPRALLFQANYSAAIFPEKSTRFTLPKLPLSAIHPWTMKLFNSWYFKRAKSKPCQPLITFNNPLDRIRHWNRLYGRKGLLQFQAVFDKKNPSQTLERLLDILRSHKATPTLAVLKVLDRQGLGLLSFCQPGFTLAIDFIHNRQAQSAIAAMNQYISQSGGRVYLAKDLLLTTEQFQQMYPKQEEFVRILKEYKTTMQSDLARRLGILS